MNIKRIIIKCLTAIVISTVIILLLSANALAGVLFDTETGCTYSAGYWKAHSIYGPAINPDPGWYTPYGPFPYLEPGEVPPTSNLNSDGPDTLLFESGLTWIEAFNTPPKQNNAWFILAYQWMAAYLNFYNFSGSGGTDIEQWLSDGAYYLKLYDGDNSGDPLIPSKSLDREDAILLAEQLEIYNIGIIGPGSCE